MELQEQLDRAGRCPIRIVKFCLPSVELSAHRHGHYIKPTRPDGH